MNVSLFVCIEGLDASGKNTQSKILAERLKAKLYSFPRYDTPMGQVIKRHLTGQIELSTQDEESVIVPGIGSVTRSVPGSRRRAPEDSLMFQALMLADKCNIADEIQDTFLGGTPVVCDRWVPSAICYGAADGVDRNWLIQTHRALPEADLNIFLDVTPEEALRRRPDARDRYERDREKQKRVRHEYQRWWSENSVHYEGAPLYAVVNGDGGGGPGSIAVVAERIWAVVETYRKENL